jgi:endogenous inhibitor of DNA gyrase (YacG/DUF329 family)
MTKKSLITCPTCQKPNTWTADNSFKPFCGERCKLIDLGAWASDAHAIAGEPEESVDKKDIEN